MEVSHSGVTGGLLVANRVDGDISIALVHAPILRQQTKEETVRDRLRKIINYVTFVHVQVTFL